MHQMFSVFERSIDNKNCVTQKFETRTKLKYLQQNRNFKKIHTTAHEIFRFIAFFFIINQHTLFRVAIRESKKSMLTNLNFK
jgi:hypothetical protein